MIFDWLKSVMISFFFLSRDNNFETEKVYFSKIPIKYRRVCWIMSSSENKKSVAPVHIIMSLFSLHKCTINVDVRDLEAKKYHKISS